MKIATLLLAATTLGVLTMAAQAQGRDDYRDRNPNNYYSQSDRDGYMDRNSGYHRNDERRDYRNQQQQGA